MIDTRSYEKEHIDGLKAKHPSLDQALIERCVFVFGLPAVQSHMHFLHTTHVKFLLKGIVSRNLVLWEIIAN